MNAVHVERVDMTIAEFCDTHNACPEGREWAIANCKTMRDVWDNANPEWLSWIATRKGVLTDKELRLFAVHCARSVEHLLTDQRSRNAIDVAERYANGEATQDELSAAESASRSAAESAARSAARSAVRSVAESVARSAARSAAWSVARSAIWSAVWSAAWSAARSAVWSAAEAAARSAAESAARSAADSAARSAARSAAWSAARSAAWSAAWSEFADHLRTNTSPCFEVKS